MHYLKEFIKLIRTLLFTAVLPKYCKTAGFACGSRCSLKLATCFALLSPALPGNKATRFRRGRLLSVKFTFESVVLLITILFFAQLSWSADLEENYLRDALITIDCRNEPVNKVLNDISRKSGLEINYDQELENEPVIIAFNDKMTAMDAIVRLLRGKNKVIEFSHGRQNLNIRFFGNSGITGGRSSIPGQ